MNGQRGGRVAERAQGADDVVIRLGARSAERGRDLLVSELSLGLVEHVGLLRSFIDAGERKQPAWGPMEASIDAWSKPRSAMPEALDHTIESFGELLRDEPFVVRRLVLTMRFPQERVVVRVVLNASLARQSIVQSWGPGSTRHGRKDVHRWCQVAASRAARKVRARVWQLVLAFLIGVLASMVADVLPRLAQW